MKTHYLIPITFLLFILLSGCMRPKVQMDTETLSSQPTPISGSCVAGECDPNSKPKPPDSDVGGNGVTAFNFTNGVIQCQFMTTPTPTLYQTRCSSFVLQTNNTMVPAQSLASGVSLRWQEPKCVNGIKIDDINCEESADGLSMECQIELDPNNGDDEGKGKSSGGSSMATMEFELEIQDVMMGTRMASGMLAP